MKNFSLSATLAPVLILAPLLTMALTATAQADDSNQVQTYRVSKSMILHPEVVTNAPEKNESEVTIPVDSLFTVLEKAVDANGLPMVHVGVDSDANVPSDFWARASEVDPSALVEMSEDQEQSGLLGAQGVKGMTYCYKFVKMYLMKIGLVREYLAGGSAWMAKNALPAAGFHMNGRRPAQAQVNDVCIYYGGRGGNGHIEVRTAAGWYYGYGYKSAPITLVNHTLIGCYSK